MNKKFRRQVLIARVTSVYPCKSTASDIQELLGKNGMQVSLRTIQRDLEEMANNDFFGLFCDQRSKPHGWSRIQVTNLGMGGAMPLTLAIAIKVWSTVANSALTPSIALELQPLIKHAAMVVSRSDSVSKNVEHMIAVAKGENLTPPVCQSLLAHSLRVA